MIKTLGQESPPWWLNTGFGHSNVFFNAASQSSLDIMAFRDAPHDSGLDEAEESLQAYEENLG
jgi:hypothetical protein